MRSSTWAWITLLSFSLPCIAQQSVPASESPMQAGVVQPSPTSRSERRIDLNVVVTDRSGKVVPGLQQQDFTVFDNKHESNILSFRAVNEESPAPEPDEIVLVIDQVNTGFDRVSFERDEVRKFLTRNGGKLAHPVSLVFFSDSGTQIQKTPSRDGNVLAAALDQNQNSLRTSRRSQGYWGAQDRLQLSLKTLSGLTSAEAARPGRKMVIWISPGWALLTGPRIELSANDAKGIFNSIVQISTSLRQAGITLYSVDPLGLADSGGLRTTYYQEFLKGITGPAHVDLADLSLQVIATQSGGLVTYGSNSVVAGLDRSIADLNAYYVLSIEAPPADKPNEYHDLAVKVAKPGLMIRTRTGYYAQP